MPYDYRQSVGSNFIKYNIEYFSLALGYAILVPAKYNVRPTDDKNGRFLFDIGITF